MAAVDLSSPHAVAFAVADTFLGDPDTSRRVADDAVAWVRARGEQAADNPIPWVIAVAVEAALAAPISPTRTFDRPRRLLAEEISGEPVATRVAVALVGICGIGHAQTAAITRRSVAEVDQLLAPWVDIIEDLGALASTTAPLSSRFPPPPPPPWAQAPEPTTGVVADPGAEPTHRQPPDTVPEEQPAAPAIGRARRSIPRLPTSVGTIVALLFVVGVVAAITVPHGERPSFAEESSRPPVSSDANCVSRGVMEATTLRVGVEQRPARLTLPPGRATAARLIVVIGDTGQSMQDVAQVTGLDAAGAREGDAVMILDGSAQPWNVVAAADRMDDVAMTTDAIRQAAASGCVDASRVVLVGYGTGGHLAAAVACSGQKGVRGLVMVRGAYAPPSCELPAGITVLIDADTTDAILPFDGGWGISAARDSSYAPSGATAAFSAWAGSDACSATEVHEDGPDGLDVTTRSTCRDDTTVTMRVRTGFGHDWPEDGAALVIRLVAGLS